MRCDLHVHSDISVDSIESMETYCERALELGVSFLSFTDHLNNMSDMPKNGYYDADKYFENLERVREKYDGRLQLLAGVEFGEPHRYRHEFEQTLKKPYDFIMGSLHIWYDGLFLSQMREVSVESAFETYWKEMYKMIEYGGYDAVAHFDFPKRLYKQVIYNDDYLNEIFALMKKNALTLEINTSLLRKGKADALPSSDILKLYKNAGNAYFTMGSDAHNVQDFYTNMEKPRKDAENLGLEEVVFIGRQAVPLL
ncbi:phosphoesterase [Clostridia bacterium]|nr:phosphoesterase [Clostridia bacterium]